MSAPNKIDITYYKHAWPLREKKENGDIVDLERSENIIKHYTETGKAAFDGSDNRNDTTPNSANGNAGFPLYKDDIDANGKPSDTSIMRDDSTDYDYLYYINRYPDIATLPPREAKEHWTNFGNSADVNQRKGRDLIKASVGTTADTITLKMPEIRQPKVRVILDSVLGVDKTYTFAIERPDNFGDAYLLSGDEIEILFKYTDTTTDSEAYAVVQTKKSVDAAQFHIELDRLDGDYYFLNTAPTKSNSANYVYQYVKLYYIEDGTQDGADGFWSTQRLQIQQIQDVVSFKAIDTRECKFEYVVPGLMNYGAHQYNTTSGPKYAYPSDTEICRYYVTTISGTGMRPSHLIGFEWQHTSTVRDFNGGTIVSQDESKSIPAPTTSAPSFTLDLSPIETASFKYFFGIVDLFKLKADGDPAVSGNHHLIQIEKDVDDQLEISVNGKNLGGSDHDTTTTTNPRYRATVVTGRYLYFNCLYMDDIDNDDTKKCILKFERKQSW